MAKGGEFMRDRIIGGCLFVDGALRLVYQGDRGQFIIEDGERIDGLLLMPEEGGTLGADGEPWVDGPLWDCPEVLLARLCIAVMDAPE
jgi:hypothetical protein